MDTEVNMQNVLLESLDELRGGQKIRTNTHDENLSSKDGIESFTAGVGGDGYGGGPGYGGGGPGYGGFDGVRYAKSLPGVTPPLGFFDPLGCCSSENITEGKIKFYREVELKHGRVSPPRTPFKRSRGRDAFEFR